MTLSYDSPGDTPAGSTFKVLPHPQESPENITVVDCNATRVMDGVGETSPVTVPQ